MKEIKDHFENLLAKAEIEAEEDKIEKMLQF